MEAKINIAEILKDKPQGTKLYSSACGKCKLEEADDKSFKISFYNSKFGFMNGGEGYLDKNGKLYDDGECVVFPSKEMRDWSKFAWKKGDILVGCAKKIIFDKFTDDTYSYFEGKYCLEQDPYSDYETYRGEDKVLLTKYFHIPERCIAQSYIKNIEERLGGKLNLDTLEIEKTQPEFKDGDIITITPQIGNNLIFIFRAEDVEKYYCHAFLDGDIAIVNKDCYCDKEFSTVRPSTKEEKNQLFDALAKKNMAWDSEHKMIVDLKPKCEFKPFDKVLGRNEKDDVWEAELFSHYREESQYPFRCIGFSRKYCIHYNEETAHLLGTTDDWEGGEQ